MKHLFGLNKMPQWAHLPLILKPDGNGKLSKRDGDRLGFPVYAMNWTDPKNNELTKGFKEIGFLPEAFINLLAVLGWNDGTEQEIYSLDELVEKFSMDRVHKGGAKFDFEKAKWYNHEWIKRKSAASLISEVIKVLESGGITVADENYLERVIELVKERCTLLPDFLQHAGFFFQKPVTLDVDAVRPKWTDDKRRFFEEYIAALKAVESWELNGIETEFKLLSTTKNIKPGELLLPLRIMLVGGKFGPPAFQIAELLGKEETINRIKKALSIFSPAS